MSPQLKPGDCLDRYEVLCPIAHGGMASVYAARLQGKRGFEKVVAIKTILPQLSGDPRLEQMFLDEARIVSYIRHPNVAELLDLGELDDLLYLVFEWVDGDSLSTLRRAAAKSGSRIPLNIVLRIMSDACAGLHAAHELCDTSGNRLEVVHRDVSPQNIMVTTSGTSKVIDFGVAKAMHRLSADTTDLTLKGKTQYMAPEQAMGQSSDRRADIWAIGAVLYQLVADRLPYEADNPMAALHMLASRMPPAPLPAQVPKLVTSIIKTALDHDERRRYPTAAAMQQALESAITKLGGPTTTTDVAAYLHDHLAERMAQRRSAINEALKAARTRSQSGVTPQSALLRTSESALARGSLPTLTSGEHPLGTPVEGRPGPGFPSWTGSGGTPGGVQIPIARPKQWADGIGKRTAIQAGAATAIAGLIASVAFMAFREAPPPKELLIRPAAGTSSAPASSSAPMHAASVATATDTPGIDPDSFGRASRRPRAPQVGNTRAGAKPPPSSAPPATDSAQTSTPATAGKDPLDVFGTR